MKQSMMETEALRLLDALASGSSCDHEIPAAELAALPQTVKVFGRVARDASSDFQKRCAALSVDEIIHLNAVDCNFFAQFMLGATF